MDFKQRDLGRFLPSHLQSDRERRQQELLEGRAVFWRAALNAVVKDPATRKRIAEKLYRREGVSLEDWPAMQPLTADERTAILREARHMLNIPEVK